MLRFETYRPRGRAWEYLGLRLAETDRGAALQTAYVQNIKVVATRPEDSLDKIRVFRFRYVPLVHHGR